MYFQQRFRPMREAVISAETIESTNQIRHQISTDDNLETNVCVNNLGHLKSAVPYGYRSEIRLEINKEK
jgi:hypothetical protein